MSVPFNDKELQSGLRPFTTEELRKELTRREEESRKVKVVCPACKGKVEQEGVFWEWRVCRLCGGRNYVITLLWEKP